MMFRQFVMTVVSLRLILAILSRWVVDRLRQPMSLYEGLSLSSSQRSTFVVSVVSVTATLAAIVVLCMETMPTFRGPRCGRQSSVDPFFVGETVCTMWFTLELVVRLHGLVYHGADRPAARPGSP